MLSLVQSPGSGFGIGASLNWLGDKVVSWVDQQIDRRLNEAGAAVVARAQALAPVRTGFLRSQEDYQIIGRTLTIILGAPYDVFTEFGTRRMAPHPHIRPALQEMRRIFGTDVEILFNRPGGDQWGGIFAHGGELALPHGLSHREREHVRRHVLPVLKKYHRGNVKRAKVRIRKFS